MKFPGIKLSVMLRVGRRRGRVASGSGELLVKLRKRLICTSILFFYFERTVSAVRLVIGALENSTEFYRACNLVLCVS